MEIHRVSISRVATNEGEACINIMELSDHFRKILQRRSRGANGLHSRFANMGKEHFNFEIPKT